MKIKNKKIFQSTFIYLVCILMTETFLTSLVGAPKFFGFDQEVGELYTIQKKEEKRSYSGTFDPAGTLITMKIKGLICDFCAQAIEKVFFKQKEVSSIWLSLEDKILRVNLKKGKSLTDTLLKKLIGDAGYNLVSIKRNRKGLK